MSAATRQSPGHVLVDSLRLDAAPEPVALFEAAERAGATRFLLMHPDSGSALMGWGQALGIAGGNAAEAERALSRAATRLAGDGARARFVGGLAFQPRRAESRAAHWRRFGNGRLWLPEFLFVWDERGVELIRALPTETIGAREEERTRQRERQIEVLSTKMAATPTRSAANDDPWVPSERYARATAETVDALRRGQADKVVLADEIERPWPAPFRSGAVLAALAEMHPGSRTFGVGLGRSSFLGATPERLACRRGRTVSTEAIAGTCADDGEDSALLHSAKERREHEFVVEAIHAELAPLCNAVEQAPREVVGTGTVRHLRTGVYGTLRGDTHILEVVGRLHPTPALGGSPRAAALDLIQRHEPFDRGWYGGPIGWCNSAGDGDFFVALRCGLAAAGGLRSFAGSGLVAASRPEAEVRETALKLASFQRALSAA